MAAGTWQTYFTARERLMDGSYDVDDHTFIAALLDNAYTPDLAAHNDLTDVSSEEITDTDYNRVTLTSVTWDETNGTVTWDCDDIDFGTSVDISARYCLNFPDTHAEDGLLAFPALNEGGSTTVSSSASNFLVQIATTGVYTLTQSP